MRTEGICHLNISEDPTGNRSSRVVAHLYDVSVKIAHVTCFCGCETGFVGLRGAHKRKGVSK
jgi:hypothetical protein